MNDIIKEKPDNTKKYIFENVPLIILKNPILGKASHYKEGQCLIGQLTDKKVKHNKITASGDTIHQYKNRA